MRKRYTRATLVAAAILLLAAPATAVAESTPPEALSSTELSAYEAEMKTKIPPKQLEAASSTFETSSCAVVKDQLKKAKTGARALCVETLNPKDVKNIPTDVSTSSIVTRPSWCENRNDGKWWGVRDGACATWVRHLDILDNVNGSVIVTGGFDFTAAHYMYTVYDQTVWAHQLQIRAFNGWGNWSGTRVTGSATCNGPCTLQESKFPAQAIIMNLDRNGESYHQSHATTRGSVLQANTTFKFWFSKPQYWDTEPIADSSPSTRCDHALLGNTSAGCVVAGTDAVKVHSLGGPYKEVVEHIRDAQAAGLPGAYPNGAPLHRTYNQDQNEANREAACPRNLFRPPGKSCDEYPFASTHEGGLTGNFSRRMVDAIQNRDAGISLNLSYYSERVLDGEAFWVYIVP